MNNSFTLILNAVLLLGMASLNNIWGYSTKNQSKKVQLFYGVVLSVLIILLMNFSFKASDGLIYDTRSVLVAITTLYFQPITIGMTVVTGLIYRLSLGGVGTLPGVMTIVGTMTIGIIWRTWVIEKTKKHRLLSNLLYGFIINLATLAYQFSTPISQEAIWDIILGIAPVVLTVFPITLALLSELIITNNTKIDVQMRVQKSEEKFQMLFKSVPNGILHFDASGNILECNDRLCSIFDHTKEYVLSQNVKSCLDPAALAEINHVFEGQSGQYSGNYQIPNGRDFYTSIFYSPMVVNEKIQGGVLVIRDLTKEHEYEEKITTLEQRDPVTGFYYRKVLNEQIQTGALALLHPIGLTTLQIEPYQFITNTLGYGAAEDLLAQFAELLSKHRPTGGFFYKNSDYSILLLTQGIDVVALHEWTSKIIQEISTIDSFISEIKLNHFTVWKENKSDSWEKVFEQSRQMMQTEKIYAKDSVTSKTIDILMASLFEKSPREKMHSERVSNLAVYIAEQMNLEYNQVKKTKAAGILHDIGKLSIDYSILDKNGKLTDEEYSIIKSHPVSGARILSSVPDYRELSNIVLRHHEHFDGTGYPNGLSKKQIPIEARIIGVADTIDAITNDRPYRLKQSFDYAKSELKKYKGTQFDPEVVETVINHWNQVQLILTSKK